MAAVKQIILPDEYHLHNVVNADKQLQNLINESEELLKEVESASDIASLYVRIVHAQRRIESIYSRLKAIENNMKTIRVPELFDAKTTTSINTLGYRVTTSGQLRTSIREDMKEEGFDWIRNHGHGNIIKEEPTIHPQTLAAWGRTMVEEGEDLPEDIFNIFTYNTTSLTKVVKK